MEQIAHAHGGQIVAAGGGRGGQFQTEFGKFCFRIHRAHSIGE